MLLPSGDFEAWFLNSDLNILTVIILIFWTYKERLWNQTHRTLVAWQSSTLKHILLSALLTTGPYLQNKHVNFLETRGVAPCW